MQHYPRHPTLYSTIATCISCGTGTRTSIVLGTHGFSPSLHTVFLKDLRDIQKMFSPFSITELFQDHCLPPSLCSAPTSSVWSALAFTVPHFSCTAATRYGSKSTIMQKLEKSCNEAGEEERNSPVQIALRCSNLNIAQLHVNGNNNNRIFIFNSHENSAVCLFWNKSETQNISVQAHVLNVKTHVTV